MNKPPSYNTTEIDFLKSLKDWELESVLRELPVREQLTVLQALMADPKTERDKDVERKRNERSKAAEVIIGPIADPERRRRCLADPKLFLKTYGLKDDGTPEFYNDWAFHHLAMIEAIHERAISGGDKAVAAPRGDGKSTVAIWMTIYIILAGLIRSLAIIAATRKKAQKLFKKIKRAFSRNELLAADFPEVCDCVAALDGAPARANKQHVGGKHTGIVWTQEEIILPFVDGSPYGGIHVAYFGLDSAIRGDRFEFALIDDPETREVAFSQPHGTKQAQHQDVEDMIDGDVAGLAGPNTVCSRVILTTIQNRSCYSYRVTDRSKKPTFAGDRYGMLQEWPKNREMWEEYVAIRKRNQFEGDKDGLEALQYYLDNRDAMEEGVIVTNPHRFNRRVNAEGVAVEVSALQSFYNKVSDWGLARVLAELQNDPEKETTDEAINITAGMVAARISGFDRNCLPPQIECTITMGLDIGKYYSHWAKVAWFGNATGLVIDYGVIETHGLNVNTESKAVELAILKALLNARTDILAENPPEFCLVDSGDYTEAVYQFVRQVGGTPFAASKGWDNTRFRMPKLDKYGQPPQGVRLFDQTYARFLHDAGLWLYNVNTEHWKHWLQQRFVTATFDDQQQFNAGSLSLFSSENRKEHLAFAHHMVAENRQEQFIPGRGLVRRWIQTNRNNHWLDAVALACSAGGCLGIKLMQSIPAEIPEQSKPKPPQPRHRQVARVRTPHQRPYLITER